jgi:Ca-activated chloride channel family protein
VVSNEIQPKLKSPMATLVAIAVVCALVLGAFTAFAPAQQGQGEGQYTIGVDVDLVVFNLTVTDGKGRHVTGLKADDFHLYEDNRLQDVKTFIAEDVPASVGLIIDNSGSMRAKQEEVVKAALAFADASNSEDEMFVVNFNENVYLGLPPPIGFTNDAGQIRSALLGMFPAGRTALYDALAAGLEHLKTGTRDRKALVVLSDGGDNASHRRLDDVLQIAQQSSATIYTIGIYDNRDLDRNPRVLRKIAEASGGRAYFPDSLQDLDQVWRDIAGGIRGQYTIGYHSSNSNRDGAFRKVRITAGRKGGQGLRVTTRDGYWAPSDKPVPR